MRVRGLCGSVVTAAGVWVLAGSHTALAGKTSAADTAHLQRVRDLGYTQLSVVASSRNRTLIEGCRGDALYLIILGENGKKPRADRIGECTRDVKKSVAVRSEDRRFVERPHIHPGTEVRGWVDESKNHDSDRIEKPSEERRVSLRALEDDRAVSPAYFNTDRKRNADDDGDRSWREERKHVDSSLLTERLEQRGWSRIIVLDDQPPRPLAEACRGHDHFRIAFDRHGEIADQERVGRCLTTHFLSDLWSGVRRLWPSTWRGDDP